MNEERGRKAALFFDLSVRSLNRLSRTDDGNLIDLFRIGIAILRLQLACMQQRGGYPHDRNPGHVASANRRAVSP